jgi:hypothetical protein
VSGCFAASGTVVGAGQERSGRYHPQHTKVIVMLDFLMIAYGVGFFVVAILYVVACEKM